MFRYRSDYHGVCVNCYPQGVDNYRSEQVFGVPHSHTQQLTVAERTRELEDAGRLTQP
jgi:hypothetical protein